METSPCVSTQAFPADYEVLRTDFNETMSKLQGAMSAIATGRRRDPHGSCRNQPRC